MGVLKDLYRRPWTLRRRLGWSLAAVNIMGTLVFSTLAYQASRQSTLDNIDDILCAAAEGVRAITPPLLADQAEDDARVEPQYSTAYQQAQAQLEDYIARTGLEFLYSIVVRKDGTAYELVSNLALVAGDPDGRIHELERFWTQGLAGRKRKGA